MLLIYNSSILQDREAYGYAKSLKNRKLKTIDVQHDKLTSLQLKELADILEMEAQELINRRSQIYLNEYTETDFDEQGYLSLLSKNPRMMKTPIAIYADNGEILGSGLELIRKEQ